MILKHTGNDATRFTYTEAENKVRQLQLDYPLKVFVIRQNPDRRPYFAIELWSNENRFQGYI